LILPIHPDGGGQLSQEEAHLYDAGILHLGYNFKPLWDSMGEAAFQALWGYIYQGKDQ